MQFLAELKRRNVLRMAGLYMVSAWLVLQVAETLLPVFDVPTWVLRAIIIFMAIGFLPAMVISWVFELTPQGWKREVNQQPEANADQVAYSGLDRRIPESKSSDPATVRANRRRIDRGIIVLLLLALSYFMLDKFVITQAPTMAGGGSKTSSQVVNGLIAVLPFRNRSAQVADEYFAEGIHDDLLTQLSKVAAFKVISRTSMMRYADSKLSIPQIAKELGAALVLEGAVQRAGDHVRITVQLIDGKSDIHLWAEKYDRALSTETIFSIQVDIAKAVAGAMKLVLSPEQSETLATGTTSNLQAYDAFIQGKLLAALDRATPERFAAAIAHFERAIALDANFAEAHARKARIQLASYWFGYADASLRDAATASAEQAHELAPDSIETLLAQAYLFYWGRLDYQRADATLQKIIVQAPDHAEAWYARALVARRDGRFNDCILALRRSLSIDPANTDTLLELINTLFTLNRFAEASELQEKFVALGGEIDVHSAESYLAKGDLDAAWAAIKGPNEFMATMPFQVALASKKPERIARALSEELWPKKLHNLPEYPETYAMAQAEALLVTGKESEAKALLQQIQARIQAQADPYPGAWSSAGYYTYYPCDLPGMLGDLEGVRAAERDYFNNAPKDAWNGLSVRLALAEAFARAGDAEKALLHLDALIESLGAGAFRSFSISSGLELLHNNPRYLAMQKAYKVWLTEQPK